MKRHSQQELLPNSWMSWRIGRVEAIAKVAGTALAAAPRQDIDIVGLWDRGNAPAGRAFDVGALVDGNREAVGA